MKVRVDDSSVDPVLVQTIRRVSAVTDKGVTPMRLAIPDDADEFSHGVIIVGTIYGTEKGYGIAIGIFFNPTYFFWFLIVVSAPCLVTIGSYIQEEMKICLLVRFGNISDISGTIARKSIAPELLWDISTTCMED
jgi:hypothetical protein